MTLAAADLSLRLPGADAPLAAVLREHAAEVIVAQTTTVAVTTRARQVIAQQLVAGGPSLTAAVQLGFSDARALRAALRRWRE